jgi:hypothetical protein
MVHTTFQLLALLYMNLFSLIYIGHSRALTSNFNNRLEMLNEYAVVACTFLMVYFATKAGEEQQYEYGWMMLSIVGFMGIINLFIII